MKPGWKAVHLDDTEAVPWNATELTWRPVRQALGAQIVGLGAYTAQRVGQELVEAHAELPDGRGQQEVYLVLRGRAAFTLDDAALDAPAGTFVLVEPHVHRHATAAEPHTAVLALGGPATFQPSASEWIERARSHLRTDPALARRIVDDLRATLPDSPGIEIGEALLAVGRGDREAAKRILGALIAREPALGAPLADDANLGPLVRQLWPRRSSSA